MSDKYTKIQFKRIKDTTKNLDSSEYAEVVPDYGEPVFSHTTNKDEMVIGDGTKTIPNLPRLNLVALNSLGTKFALPAISEGDTNTYNIITTKNISDIPDASTTVRGLVNTSSQTFAGNKTFASNTTTFGSDESIGTVVIKGTDTSLMLRTAEPWGAWQAAIAPSISRSTITFTSQDVSNGRIEYYRLPSLALSDPNQGDYKIITTKNISDIPDASGAKRGLVSTDAQTFAGDKTFQDDVTINGDLIVGGETIVKHKLENNRHVLYCQTSPDSTKQVSLNFGMASAGGVWISSLDFAGYNETIPLLSSYRMGSNGNNYYVWWPQSNDTNKKCELLFSVDNTTYVQYKHDSTSGNPDWKLYPKETPRIFTTSTNADKVGDFRVDTSGKKLYLWDGSAWKQIASFEIETQYQTNGISARKYGPTIDLRIVGASVDSNASIGTLPTSCCPSSYFYINACYYVGNDYYPAIITVLANGSMTVKYLSGNRLVDGTSGGYVQASTSYLVEV